MRILIRQQAADGTWKETPAESSRVSIGRATHQVVQLPGLMVALEHAEIQLAGAAVYRMSAKALTGVEFEGSTGVREAVLKPGDVIGIGGHQLKIEPPRDGYDLVLSVVLLVANTSVVRTPPRLDLDSGGLGKRKPALAIVVALLVLGLVIPLAMIAMGRPALLRQVLPTDAAWSGGPVTSGHAHFGHQCQTCHESAFRSIRDTSCAQCHANVKHHADNPAVAELSGFKDRRCADCHQEHRGQAALIPQNPSLCTGCHAKPGKLQGFSDMPAVTDFKRGHPDFRYTVSKLSDTGGKLETTRMSAGAEGKAKDVSGSLFPHDTHLAAAGIKGPNGKEKLVCESCHVPDAAHAGFRDLDFQKHCQRCHELKLVTPERTLELPHGQNDASRFLVEMFYVPSVRQHAEAAAASAETTAEPARRRVGEAEATSTAAIVPDNKMVVSEVFEYQVCGKCHLIDNTGEHPRVIPPKLRHTWMPAAKFTHAPHNAVPCADCHAVATSHTGADLNLPGVETCRKCHVGTHDREGVKSTCVSCHNMHRADQQPMNAAADVAALARKPSAVAGAPSAESTAAPAPAPAPAPAAAAVAPPATAQSPAAVPAAAPGTAP